MLAFHGTGGPRSFVDKIFDEGLIPLPHTWTADTTGISSHVFACTTPIGGKGGDPIHFAQRRLYGTDDTAWLLVLDVPPASIRGAVPNHELEQYFVVQSFASVAFERSATDLRDLILHKRERGVAARELLEYRVTATAPELTTGPPDAHTLVQFEHAFIRARDRDDKARVAASYKLTLPADYLEDPHYPWCLGCMHQLFTVDIVVPGTTSRFSRGAWRRLDLTHFASLVDAIDRWLPAEGSVPTLTSLSALQRAYPPPRDRVPRAMWPDFVTHDLATRIREPDTQILLDHVPPAQIVGAIGLGTRTRLSNLVRPRDGETLLRKLNYLAAELVQRRKRADRPVVFES